MARRTDALNLSRWEIYETEADHIQSVTDSLGCGKSLRALPPLHTADEDRPAALVASAPPQHLFERHCMGVGAKPTEEVLSI